jgi:pyruvate/2-oxoglutarate dehydrogenase complex dihydrolipoamide dehydrogenase (E3) component
MSLPQLEPFDDFNQKLESCVHPTDWANPTPASKYNLVVIGAGTAGLVTAAGAAGLGAKVALVERELMGGDCLNVGCVPSKALISSARVVAVARESESLGVSSTSVSVDFAAIMQRMRRLRSEIAPNDSVQRFADLGIDVFLGDAKFSASGQVRVGDVELNYKKAVIATGARASAPPISGLDKVRYLTNETVFSLTELPKRLGIIGAGPIGCELAQSFARFGSEVFLVESTHGIMPREDQAAAAIVKNSLIQSGVNLLCCGQNLTLEPVESNKIRLRVDSHEIQYEEVVDELLVAVGRAPNVTTLGLENVGVEFDAVQGVIVNDRLQTSNSKIYAAGDVCSRFKFTHAADFMARTVIQNALFFGRAKASSLLIPWCTYTSPEIAHVGLSEADAKERGVAHDIYLQEFADVDRAILEGETAGFVKVVAKKGKDRILGATIVAQNAGDMIGELTLAMKHGIGLGSIASTIHPYPTCAEAIRKVGDQFNRTRLTPSRKRLLEKFLAFRR